METENNPTEEAIPKKRTAFSELMSPKSKQPMESTASQPASAKAYGSDPRGGLLHYIKDPQSCPHGLVIYHNDKFVLIRDMFAKATVHLLLLSRDPAKYILHPHEALAIPDFLQALREEVKEAKALAAKELRRQLGKFSALDKSLHEAMDLPDLPEQLPEGRDWMKEIKVGVHAHPSMTHLHIHIISRDMHSLAMKHRKHYNSFNTEFFIPLEDYPLAEDDIRRETQYQNDNLKKDFICWRCQKNFGNRFKALKDHLESEFDDWKRE